MSDSRTSVSTLAGVSLLAIGAILVPVAYANDGQVAKPPFDGAALYRSYCASCHGETARGDGAVAMYLRRKPADLTQIAARHKGKFPEDRIVQLVDGRQTVRAHGESQMPVWGDAFSRTTTDSDEASIKAKITALVHYLASIQAPPAR